MKVVVINGLNRFNGSKNYTNILMGQNYLKLHEDIR
jgi:hypothetical protein